MSPRAESARAESARTESAETETGDTASAPTELRLALHVDARAVGGAVLSLTTLLKALDSSVEVNILFEQQEVGDLLLEARPGARWQRLPAVRNKFDLRSIARQAAALRRIGPDVVHVNLDNAFTGQYGLMAAKLSRIPVVATVHSPYPPVSRSQERLVRLLARRIDRYVSISADTARATERYLSLAEGSVEVVHNGVFDPPRPAEPKQGAKVLGAIGRFVEEKGLDVLIRALPAVPEASLVLVGDGPLRPDLEALAAGLGVTGRVRFAGWSQGPWSGQHVFDAVVVPSIHEGLPLVVLEAMACGIPVIASRIGGIPEAVVDGVTGFLVDPGQPDALAQVLRRLVVDEQLRSAMGASARERFLECFTATRMAEHYLSLYRSLARTARQVPGTTSRFES